MDILIATRSLQEGQINRLIMDSTHFIKQIKMSANLVIIEKHENLKILISDFNIHKWGFGVLGVLKQIYVNGVLQP